MKVKVKAPFFDENGIHKVGEICEVSRFNPERMEPVEEKKASKPISEEIIEEKFEEKKEKVEKAVRTDSKKNTRKKV